MPLCEEGSLDLDAPLTLFRRGGGIGRLQVSLRDLPKVVAQLPLARQPGESMRYSIAHDLAGSPIERVTGKRLGDFLQERISGPLAMSDTAFYVPSEKQNRFAAMYGVCVLREETVAAMTANHLVSAQYPVAFGSQRMAGWGCGLGLGVIVLRQADGTLPGTFELSVNKLDWACGAVRVIAP